jgi:hypothetical protein
LSDILDVLVASGFTKSLWFDLGLKLGLLYPALKDIETKFRADPSRCLTECLYKWLTMDGDHRWQVLADCLERLNQNTVSRKLLETKKCLEVLQKYNMQLLKIELTVDMKYRLKMERVIVDSSVNIVTTLRNAILSKNHKNLWKFAVILKESEAHSILADQIVNDYNLIIDQSNNSRLTNNVDSFQSQSLKLSTSGSSSASAATGAITRGDNTFQVEISVKHQHLFDDIRCKFGFLKNFVTNLAVDRITSSEELKIYIEDCFPELKSHLLRVDNIRSIIDVLKNEKCNILNVKALEAVVSKYKIDEAKKEIEGYKHELEQFCSTKLQAILDKVLFSKDPLNCETIQFILNWSADDYTLNDVHYLLEKAFGELNRRVIVKTITEGRSIVIICYAPRHLIDVLFMEAENNIDQLKERGLKQLTIGYYTAYDSIRDKVRVQDLQDRDSMIEDLKIKLDESIKKEQFLSEERDDISQKLTSEIKLLNDKLAISKLSNDDVLFENQKLKAMLEQENSSEIVEWYSGEVVLYSPTESDWEKVKKKLLLEKEVNKVEHRRFSLYNPSLDVGTLIISQLNETSIDQLFIRGIPLNQECLHHLYQLELKRLHLNDCRVSSDDLDSAIRSLTNTVSLKNLSFYRTTITISNVNSLINLLTHNDSIDILTVDKQYTTHFEQHEQYTKVQHKIRFL